MILLLPGTYSAQSQTAWFADGYHGGIYGHYPMWQARFMVETLTENPAWAINLEIEPETWDTVSVKDAENFKLLQEYYSKTGRFGRIEFVNPAYAQPYCYNISGESIIRQFAYGIEKTRAYFPEATFITYSVEEPCFTSSLPQILKGFGYRYAVLRNPNTCWGGYTSAFGKDLVNWIGPDGSSIPAVPRYACEGLSTKSTWQTESWTNSNSFIEKCFASGIQYPVGMTFQDAGWDGGPWGNQYKPTEYTTWTAYINMIQGKVQPDDWKFSIEDVKPGLVWGAQVLQQIAQEVRVSENKMVVAEKMASLNYLLYGEEFPATDIAEGWRTLMLAQHHDCWIVPYNGRPGDTWADKVTRWTDASNRIADDKISQLFELDEPGNAETVRVFNTLGISRTDVVEIELPERFRNSGFSVFDWKGKELPAQVSVGRTGKPVLAFEATVPAFGYATFQVKNGKSKQKQAVKQFADGKLQLETAFYRAVFDPASGGEIISLIDKKQGNRQLVEKGKGLNSLRGYFYKEEKFRKSSDAKARVSVVEDGALFTQIKVENQLAGNLYTQLIRFAKTSPLIDFELSIDWNGQPAIGAYDQGANYKAEDWEKAFYDDGYKLQLQFPLAGMNGKLYKNAPFDVCESQLENTIYTSWDQIKHNVILNWVDAESSSGGYGVALFSDHTTSYIRTEELPIGLTVQYAGKGLWGRNYGVDGPTQLRYALLPHAGNWETAGIEPASAAWNEPLIGRFIHAGNEPDQFSLLEVTDKNLHVSAVTVDGDDLLVRFYNSSKNSNQEVCWNCQADVFELVDLNGKVISSLQKNKNRNGDWVTNLNLPQFGFQTVKLTKVKLK
ncbi:glycoside hydrolase family 38 C-terminal domain-containing protein [Gaoshiqia sp. Z1-71]|uniref:glycoside hydrolase family 38 C-terminal domain-containing protein n=1 Tax=Gaoshiqia hydrogeniformans TaxID=3290090 RepID=UPI003BF8E5A5